MGDITHEVQAENDFVMQQERESRVKRLLDAAESLTVALNMAQTYQNAKHKSDWKWNEEHFIKAAKLELEVLNREMYGI